MSTYWSADRSLDAEEPIPIGKPFQNTDLLLVGEDGKRVPDGEKGEIYLRGTCVTLGYYNNPEKTAEENYAENKCYYCDGQHLTARGYDYTVGMVEKFINKL